MASVAAVDNWNETLIAVHQFLCSDDGVGCVRANLARRRLPAALDTDIEGVVFDEARRFLATGAPIVNPPAWCRQRIAARTIDMVRGRIRRERTEGVRTDLDDWDMLTVAGSDGGVDDVELECDRVDVVRQHLAVMSPDWVAAGALAFVARITDNVTVHPRCPQPQAGATPVDAACWVGLWYAGMSECFDSDAAAPATIRRRRARAADKLRAAVERCAGDLAAPNDGGRTRG